MSIPKIEVTPETVTEHLSRLARLTSLAQGIGEATILRARLENVMEAEAKPGTILVAPKGYEFVLRFMSKTVTLGGYLDGNNSHAVTGLTNPREVAVEREFEFKAGMLEVSGVNIIGISHDQQTACRAQLLDTGDGNPSLFWHAKLEPIVSAEV